MRERTSTKDSQSTCNINAKSRVSIGVARSRCCEFQLSIVCTINKSSQMGRQYTLPVLTTEINHAKKSRVRHFPLSSFSSHSLYLIQPLTETIPVSSPHELDTLVLCAFQSALGNVSRTSCLPFTLTGLRFTPHHSSAASTLIISSTHTDLLGRE